MNQAASMLFRSSLWLAVAGCLPCAVAPAVLARTIPQRCRPLDGCRLPCLALPPRHRDASLSLSLVVSNPSARPLQGQITLLAVIPMGLDRLEPTQQSELRNPSRTRAVRMDRHAKSRTMTPATFLHICMQINLL